MHAPSTNGLAAIILSWSLLSVIWGCGSPAVTEPEPIVVTPDKDGPYRLLLSEVLAAEDRQLLIRPEFTIQNRTDTPQTLRLTGKSCTCYQVLVDGQSLDVDALVTIDPQASRRLRLDVSTPTAAGERTWRSTLRVNKDDASSTDVTVSATARIVDDARLEPNVITLGDSAATAGASRQVTLRVRHTWRGEMVASVPEVVGLPASCSVMIVNPHASAEVLEPGLWQRLWELSVEVPPGVLTDAGLHSLDVVFDGDGTPPVTARGRLLVEARRGVVAPDVVHLGRVPIGTGRRRRIVLAADDGRAFRITGRTEDEPSAETELLVEFDDAATALRHVVEIEWTMVTAGTRQRSLVLTTDHPRSPRVVIKVQGIGIAATGEDATRDETPARSG